MAFRDVREEVGVVIGPLRMGQSPDNVARLIFQLFNSIGIQCSDIARISVNPAASIAKVELHQRDCEDFALRVLKEGRSVMSLFDLRRLTDKPKYFKVERIIPLPSETQEHSALSDMMLRRDQMAQMQSCYIPLPQGGLSMRRDVIKTVPEPSAKAKDIEKSEDNLGDQQIYDIVSLGHSTSSRLSPLSFHKLEEEEDTEPRQWVCLSAATSMSGIPTVKVESKKDPNLIAVKGLTQKKSTVNAKTSTPQLDTCFCQGTSFYHRLQVLNTDARNVYLDQGKIVTSDLRAFRMLIGRLVCAFLNSEGGAVFFGVEDTGEVKGINISQRYEDALRLDIDGQVKMISPSVPTSTYKVNFAQVMDTTGHILPDVKILEVKVTGPETPDTVYTLKNIKYIWVDGRPVEAGET